MSVYLYIPRSPDHNIRVVNSQYPIERAYLLLPPHLKSAYTYHNSNRLEIHHPPAKFIRVYPGEEACYNLGDF